MPGSVVPRLASAALLLVLLSPSTLRPAASVGGEAAGSRTVGRLGTGISAEIERQMESFYNVTEISRLSLADMNWSEEAREEVGSLTLIRGRFTAGTFEGYSRDGELVDAPLTMEAVTLIPREPSDHGIVVALHEEENLERKWELFGEDLRGLSESTGAPILLYVQDPPVLGPLSLTRGELTIASFYALAALNSGHTDVVTANFPLALARTQSYAITLLQRLTEGETGSSPGEVGFMGGSKEGYAQWLASTFDGRIAVSLPAGFKMENMSAAISEGESQWGCRNPYLKRMKKDWTQMLRLREFFRERPDVEAAVTAAGRVRAGLARADFYLVSGDVGAYGTHDGSHFPLGRAEAEFLEGVRGRIRWAYTLVTGDEGSPQFLRKVETLAWLLQDPENREAAEGYSPHPVEVREVPGGLEVRARVAGDPVRVLLYYAASRDKVWNSPDVEWERVEMRESGDGYWSAVVPDPGGADLAYSVVVEVNLSLGGFGFTARFSTPLMLREVLPPKTCDFDPRCVPGLSCVTGVDREAMGPGQILSVKPLDVLPTPPGGEYGVAVLYVNYWSSARGGVRIGAKLYWPVGRPPAGGWPVRVWSHGYGGPGSDYWHYPFVDEPAGGPRGEEWGLAYAGRGFVCLHPWQAGAGPSEPFMGYSPLSVWDNQRVLFDGLKALENLPDAMARDPEISSRLPELGLSPGDLRLDLGRAVVATNCISSPTLMAFARELAVNRSAHPEARGVRALVADTFNPSVAYICGCLLPVWENLTGEEALANLNLWISVVWTLTEAEGWDKDVFFTDELVKMYSAPSLTPAGVMPLVRSAQAEPPLSREAARLNDPMWARLRRKFGFDDGTPAREIARVLLSDRMLGMMEAGERGGVEGVLGDPLYREYFARSDPFFEENVEPFDPGIPLLVPVSSGDEEYPGMVGPPRLHAECMALPRVETLRSWGWDVEVLYEPGVGLSSASGRGLEWCYSRLRDLLGMGEEEGGGGSAGWFPYVLGLPAAAAALALIWLLRRLRSSRRREGAPPPAEGGNSQNRPG